MHRFFTDRIPDGDGCTALTDEDAFHALKVLRLRVGDQAELVAAGVPWLAVITEISGGRVRLRTVSALPSSEPDLRVTLFQGVPKSDKMDLIVQKATELGVARIVPLCLSRCVSRPGRDEMLKKTARWQKIAREAGKQSGRCVIPTVEEPLTLAALLERPDLPSVNIVPWEGTEGFGPLAFREKHPLLSDLGVVIGPEGGIDADEIGLLREAGFIPITLGRRILRTETAGPAVLAALMCLYGEMERP